MAKEKPARSANLLVSMILSTPALVEGLKADPEEVLNAVAAQVTESLPPPAYISDTWTYRIVVSALGIVAAGALIGAVALARQGVAIPDVLTALGSAAIGALAGMVAATK